GAKRTSITNHFHDLGGAWWLFPCSRAATIDHPDFPTAPGPVLLTRSRYSSFPLSTCPVRFKSGHSTNASVYDPSRTSDDLRRRRFGDERLKGCNPPKACRLRSSVL